MTVKQTRKKYPKAFKEEAVELVTEQGYSVPKAAEAVVSACAIIGQIITNGLRNVNGPGWRWLDNLCGWRSWY